MSLPGPVPAPARAVVTGANSGIGRATAVLLAQKGYDVIGTVRDVAKAGKLLAEAEAVGGSVTLVELDVADEASTRAGFAEILEGGPVDVLVANAGIGGNGTVEDTSTERYREVMEVNAWGVVRCAQAVLPGMRDRRRGAIVIVSSVVGRIGAIAQAPYTVSKWAAEGIGEELALEVAPFNVRVAIVEPGITKSAIFAKNTDGMEENGPYGAQYRRMFRMYAVGIPQATPAAGAAETIHEAITTPDARLRWACSWGGVELTGGRSAITDEQWVELGLPEDDAEYYAKFKDAFGLDLT